MQQSLAKPSLLEILRIILLRITGNFLKLVWGFMERYHMDDTWFKKIAKEEEKII